MKTDIEIARDILDKEFHVTTISWPHLEWFSDECKKHKSTKSKEFISGPTVAIRNRFRKALNSLYEQGYCTRSFIGTTYYQTSDTLGGKVCLCWSKIF